MCIHLSTSPPLLHHCRLRPKPHTHREQFTRMMKGLCGGIQASPYRRHFLQKGDIVQHTCCSPQWALKPQLIYGCGRNPPQCVLMTRKRQIGKKGFCCKKISFVSKIISSPFTFWTIYLKTMARNMFWNCSVKIRVFSRWEHITTRYNSQWEIGGSREWWWMADPQRDLSRSEKANHFIVIKWSAATKEAIDRISNWADLPGIYIRVQMLKVL